MVSKDYLKLSMRHLQLEHIAFDHKMISYHLPHSRRNRDLGEAVYTLNTSNFSWPRGVTYPEMMQVRKELFWSMHNEHN